MLHDERQGEAFDLPQTIASAEKQAVPVLINTHIQLNNGKSFSLSSLLHCPRFEVSLRLDPKAERGQG